MFEWDERTNRINLEKHGIAFEDVVPVFNSADAMVVEDARRNYGETRCLLIGPIEGVVVCVAYTLRAGQLRLISARRANRRERKLHEQG